MPMTLEGTNYDWTRAARSTRPSRVESVPIEWDRVSKSKPCKVCQKPDWCTRERLGRFDCCMRITSDRPAANGGWLHNLSTTMGEHVQRYSDLPERQVLDVWSIFKRWNRDSEMIDILAMDLGVSGDSLRRLHVHHDQRTGVFGFPMWVAGRAVGIRTRNPDGSKRSIKGSQSGLFLADGDWTPTSRPNADPVMIAEGPTDTAALMTIGFDAVIGRPSCRGQHGNVAALVRSTRRDAVIVADLDGPGREGAMNLANDLTGAARTVRVIVPPRGNDIREWIQVHHGTKDVLDRVIDAARYHRRSENNGG